MIPPKFKKIHEIFNIFDFRKKKKNSGGLGLFMKICKTKLKSQNIVKLSEFISFFVFYNVLSIELDKRMKKTWEIRT